MRLALLVVLLLFSACAQTLLEPPKNYSIIKAEGDLITLQPQGADPDNDTFYFTFNPPFNESGQWQTTFGDAGLHDVTVTITDENGASNTTSLLIFIEKSNRPPIIDCPTTIFQAEGDLVTLDCTIYDEEDEKVTITISGWMQENEKQTNYQDAGAHDVRVSATDTTGNTAHEDLTIIIQDVNLLPLFPDDFPQQLVATAGDILTLPINNIQDPDLDEITFTISEPFTKDGVWETTMNDVGSHRIDVVASDGYSATRKTVIVDIAPRNRPPVLERISDITVEEGDTILLNIVATDPDGDDVTITIDGFMTTDTYTTTYDDAGEYTTTITATDGTFTDTQIVNINILDKNRAPYFIVPN